MPVTVAQNCSPETLSLANQAASFIPFRSSGFIMFNMLRLVWQLVLPSIASSCLSTV